ncbi:MAG: hypothetical protein JWO08_1167 [Verrucomicrobiaceae bacterium]|nr:hypothetical protein [Verrucomicrobiaceae bacterium]
MLIFAYLFGAFFAFLLLSRKEMSGYGLAAILLWPLYLLVMIPAVLWWTVYGLLPQEWSQLLKIAVASAAVVLGVGIACFNARSSRGKEAQVHQTRP